MTWATVSRSTCALHRVGRERLKAGAASLACQLHRSQVTIVDLVLRGLAAGGSRCTFPGHPLLITGLFRRLDNEPGTFPAEGSRKPTQDAAPREPVGRVDGRPRDVPDLSG